MKIEFKNSDAFEVEADCLLSSGNVQLNMSGGVNGALLGKYGAGLQRELHGYLEQNAIKQVEPGFIYRFEQNIPPYHMVLYAVGVDVWYHSSRQLVREVFHQALTQSSQSGLKTMASVAIATGYGNLSLGDFIMALKDLPDFAEMDSLYICERNRLRYNQMVSIYDDQS